MRDSQAQHLLDAVSKWRFQSRLSVLQSTLQKCCSAVPGSAPVPNIESPPALSRRSRGVAAFLFFDHTLLWQINPIVILGLLGLNRPTGQATQHHFIPAARHPEAFQLATSSGDLLVEGLKAEAGLHSQDLEPNQRWGPRNLATFMYGTSTRCCDWGMLTGLSTELLPRLYAPCVQRTFTT